MNARLPASAASGKFWPRASALAMTQLPLLGRVIAIVGGGPAGLFAAEQLLPLGAKVSMFDAMGSLGRKFLIAGKGGLNLTHSEPKAQFRTRYSEGGAAVSRWLDDFDADDLRAFAAGLGVPTMVGTSGRVFPADLKAAPMLRAWLRRLRASGLQVFARHRLEHISEGGALRFSTPDGAFQVSPDACVLALGGGSWAKLGSDGAWVHMLKQRGIALTPLMPSNCGFLVAWSAIFKQRAAGQAIKPCVLHFNDQTLQGEFVVTDYGVEGSAMYALSAALRRALLSASSESQGNGDAAVTLAVDVLPSHSIARIEAVLVSGQKRSLSEQLRRGLNLSGARLQLVFECTSAAERADPAQLARRLKRLPIQLTGMRPMDEAISTAGGVCLTALDENMMLTGLPGVFCAGEMLDWDAPTGGYLLTGCFASAHAAAAGVARWLRRANVESKNGNR
jgi:uncharacterized flavoprotein (TIGR03862 family)